MKLFAPAYYKDFKCIADRCRHSCCIGWEIDIDSDTLSRYFSSENEYSARIKESISFEGTPHFRLAEGERCPHLDGCGLCRIITEHGEGYLSDICREHPRFYNRTARGLEVGLGMACEEAARLILSSDAYSDIIEIGKEEGRAKRGYNAIAVRDKIYSRLSDESVDYIARLDSIFSEYKIPKIDPALCGERIINSLEYLDESHRALFLASVGAPRAQDGAEVYLERALAYFIYRHLSGAKNEREARKSLALSLFLEELFARLISSKPDTPPAELARILSEEIEYSEDNTKKTKKALAAF